MLVSELEERSRNFQRYPKGSINLLDPFGYKNKISRYLSLHEKARTVSFCFTTLS